MSLKNKTAIITGAGSGVGRAMAKLFSKQGANIVAADYNEKTLATLVAEIEESGGKIVGVKANVADQAECEAMVDAATTEFGQLDILVNNAGVMDLMQAVGDLDLGLWRRVMSINVDGPMYAMRKAIPIMLEQGSGVILNTASVAGVGGAAAGAAYVASKHAVVGLTRNTAWMYAKRGIRCNAIALGSVNTGIMESVDMTKLDPVGGARAGEYHALMPQSQEPEDIADVALFMVSDQAKHLNGVILPVDGGWRSA